jgi:nitrate reductase molybdenum cofactor assembly chaperone NarJ/NarW
VNRVLRKAAARQAVSREHALVHRAAALLLEYPSEELLGMLPLLREALTEVPDRLGAPLLRVVDHLADTPLDRLQADYVETFDLRRRCSLYLSYYAYGDTRKRGVALVEFKQAYRAGGLEIAAEELPDHLAIVLEFAATGDDDARAAGINLLLAHRAGLELLRVALQDAGSPWADVLVAVSGTLPALDGPDREAVARLAAEGPPGEEVGLEPFAPPSYMPATGARR